MTAAGAVAVGVGVWVAVGMEVRVTSRVEVAVGSADARSSKLAKPQAATKTRARQKTADLRTVVTSGLRVRECLNFRDPGFDW